MIVCLDKQLSIVVDLEFWTNTISTIVHLIEIMHCENSFGFLTKFQNQELEAPPFTKFNMTPNNFVFDGSFVSNICVIWP
jgi:hypothetical protein